MLDKLSITKSFSGGRHAYHCYKKCKSMKGLIPAKNLSGKDAIGWFIPSPTQSMTQVPQQFPHDYQNWIDGWELERTIDKEENE